MEEIVDIYQGIKNLPCDNINSIMQCYDRLNTFQLRNANIIDGRLREIMDKIMTIKMAIHIETLNPTIEKSKWDTLDPMQLPINFRANQPQDFDILWRFLRDEDLTTEEERHALGIEQRYYYIWKDTWVDLVNEKVTRGITDIDNIVAKCICTLDRCLKIFCMSETGARTNYNQSHSGIGKRKRVHLLLDQMKQLLLQ
jgi:hypothetical protein